MSMRMQKNNNDIIYTAQVSSLDELRAALPKEAISSKSAARFVALSVTNPSILVCPFQFFDIEKREIKDQLALKAVELLALPLDAIGLDYQILDSNEGQVRGVFACYPKQTVGEYLSVLDEAGFIPIKIVPSIIAGMDSFLQKNRGQKGRLCLLDFSRANVIYFASFLNGHCDFLREIPYEDTDEIEHEVMQSLRCACATSSVKQFNQIYFSGDIPKGQKLKEKIEKTFSTGVTWGVFTDVEASLTAADNVLSLNLVKDRTFSLKQRQMITKTTRAVLSVFCAMAFLLSLKIVSVEVKLNEMKSSFSTKDYKHALDLQKRLEAK